MTKKNEEVVDEKKEKTVPVPESLLRELLARDKKRDEEIAMLKEVADLSRMDKWEKEHRGELIRSFNVSTIEYEGAQRIVLAWKTLRDEVWKEGDVHKFKQTSEYTLDMGEGKDVAKIELDQVTFKDRKKFVSGQVVKESKSNTGETRTLKFDDGREIEIDITFLN